MFKRVVLLAAWTGLCMYFPALAAVDPLVKPVIDKVHYQTPDTLSVQPYYDGRKCPKDAVCDTVCQPCGDACQCQKCDCPTAETGAGNPVWRVVSAPFRSGFWCKGPIRRIVSAPIRFLFRC